MEIRVNPTMPYHADIDQLPIKRDWMEETFDRHAYHCFPMSLANRFGWGISFNEDIGFIYDGGADPNAERVKVTKGHKYVHVNRANHTISFETNLKFEADENVSLLTMPVPNQFIDGAQCITTIISTSVLPGSLPVAWMITKPNYEFIIPAGTPVAAVIPVSIASLEEYELTVSNKLANSDFPEFMKARGDAAEKLNSTGNWSHFYRDAVDHLGNPFGKHEAKKITMPIKRV